MRHGLKRSSKSKCTCDRQSTNRQIHFVNASYLNFSVVCRCTTIQTSLIIPVVKEDYISKYSPGAPIRNAKRVLQDHEAQLATVVAPWHSEVSRTCIEITVNN